MYDTFKALSPVKVFDKRGQVIYMNNKPPFLFNLKTGKYSRIYGRVKKMPFKANFDMKLPRHERRKPLRKYKVIYSENPDKCTIYYEKGLIVLDNSFKDAPDFVRDFVLLHELGHHYYSNEVKTDLFAAKQMLKQGYNPSQIALVPLFLLNDKNRSLAVANYMRKNIKTSKT